VVHSAYRVDLSHLDSGGVTNGIRSDLHGHERMRVTGVDMRLIACVGLAGCIAHVPALDVRSRVLRGTFLVTVCLVVGVLVRRGRQIL